MPEWSLDLLKVVHIGALVLWIGPTLGAWWMLRLASHRFGEPGMVSQYLYQAFLDMLCLEHGACAALLLSGAAMAWLHGWFGQPWLQVKLLLVLSLVVPLEVVDIWLGHVRLRIQNSAARCAGTYCELLGKFGARESIQTDTILGRL
jgi:uncharacterized membrane protein